MYFLSTYWRGSLLGLKLSLPTVVISDLTLGDFYNAVFRLCRRNVCYTMFFIFPMNFVCKSEEIESIFTDLLYLFQT
jgi:hypothetical protein